MENRRKLQVLQNRGLRCALNKGPYESSDELHAEARLYKLKFRREQHLLNFMYDWALDPKKLKVKTKGAAVTRSHSVAGTDHTVCTAATAGKQGSVASVRRADRSGARRIQHVCKCNVDPVKSDLTKLLCFS